jgi:hypothetical protein
LSRFQQADVGEGLRVSRLRRKNGVPFQFGFLVFPLLLEC